MLAGTGADLVIHGHDHRASLGSIAADVATTAPEAPVLFVIGRVAALYDQIALADALTCDGAGMAAYA